MITILDADLDTSGARTPITTTPVDTSAAAVLRGTATITADASHRPYLYAWLETRRAGGDDHTWRPLVELRSNAADRWLHRSFAVVPDTECRVSYRAGYDDLYPLNYAPAPPLRLTITADEVPAVGGEE